MEIKKKIVVVTPAGRRAYLDLMKHYILGDADIAEWHLWDNCRDPEDRIYINSLADKYRKIKVIEIDLSDGTNLSVNKFYKFCNDPDVFYIKMDDDLVYLSPGLANILYQSALIGKQDFAFWSPIVINNAICSALLKSIGKISTNVKLSSQASCPNGWGSPEFANKLHQEFLKLLKLNLSITLDTTWNISLSRFSINCIGFWGADVLRLGDKFCPLDVDDEEWISAQSPSITNRMGRLVGSACVSHYSFYTQERFLNQTNVLDCYYDIAGLKRTFPLPKNKKNNIFLKRIIAYLKRKYLANKQKVDLKFIEL